MPSETRRASAFEHRTCSAPDERSARMRDIVIRHLPPTDPITVLDVGCGTGSLIFRLADALPHASVTGIDISRANIAAADAERRRRAVARVQFVTADYAMFDTSPVDAIVTDTVLHFIPGGAVALWRKLASDLRPGGTLVCCMARDTVYNHALGAARRLMRRLRSRWSDAAIVALARVVYGRQMDVDRLRERMEYMYIPPEQFMTRRVMSDIAPSLGLQLVAEYDMPATSATQLKQRISVFYKERTEH